MFYTSTPKVREYNFVEVATQKNPIDKNGITAYNSLNFMTRL